MGLHRDLVIAGQDGDVRWAEHDPLWECCRPLRLQKAQTLDGSGPMRLGSSFRFQSSKTPVIVALALPSHEQDRQ